MVLEQVFERKGLREGFHETGSGGGDPRSEPEPKRTALVQSRLKRRPKATREPKGSDHRASSTTGQARPPERVTREADRKRQWTALVQSRLNGRPTPINGVAHSIHPDLASTRCPSASLRSASTRSIHRRSGRSGAGSCPRARRRSTGRLHSVGQGRLGLPGPSSQRRTTEGRPQPDPPRPDKRVGGGPDGDGGTCPRTGRSPSRYRPGT